MPLREELFTNKVACPMGASLEDQAIVARWLCLYEHYFPDKVHNTDDNISTDKAEVARKADWDIILKLSARHSVQWCNDFIYSLTTRTTVAENPVYGIDHKHLKTLLTLQKDFQLQSCDLSSPMFEQGSLFNPGSSHHTLDQQSLATMARSLAKPPNDGKFNRIFLDEVSDFLLILSDESLDLIKQLTQKSF